MKSNIFSEERNHQVQLLIQNLNQLQQVVESGFWLSTDELGLLLNLEPSMIENLQSIVASQSTSQQIKHKFPWRNFECHLVDCQSSVGFWMIKNRPSGSSDNSQFIKLNTQETPVSNPSAPSNQSAQSEIIPSPYALIENFLSPQQLSELLRYSINKQPEFVPTTNSANDPNYRRSFYLTYFPEFSELMSATRVLTYVYYFHREPKSFTGGELVIYDSKSENGYLVAAKSHKVIQPTNNTIIFFPSQCMHEVLPVSCPSEYFADSRFTINGWLRRV